jgi:ADP-ribose pyrophosphatase YjhB (NUDIX family)
MKELDNFNVVLLGIIFDPKRKKILIGKRKKDPYIKNLTWAFPGGRLNHNEDMEKAIKQRVMEKTGLKVENLGSVFSKAYPERKELISIYFLCEATGGKEKAADDFTELKWVNPEDIEKHFTTSFHPHLKEYILNLK